MLKRLFVVLLFVPLLFSAGCNKGSDNTTSSNQLTISGVKDVNMGTSGESILALAVATSSGIQEDVTISVTGLPAGISAVIAPTTGTPPFGVTITFIKLGTTAAGTYPIHVVGNSATYTKSYDLNLAVPAVTGNQFVINGVHDVNMGTAGGNILPLSVALSSGVQEQVTLSVTNLPAGMSAAISPVAGTPAFSSTITFTQTGSTPAGTYVIKIVGTSASYTKSYDVNLIVSAINGFLFDGNLYNATSASGTVSNANIIFSAQSTDFGGGNLICYIYQGNNNSLSDGTYTYHIDGTNNFTLDKMRVSFVGAAGSFDLKTNTVETATLKKIGTKISISFPQITLDGGSAGQKTISANVNQ